MVLRVRGEEENNNLHSYGQPFEPFLFLNIHNYNWVIELFEEKNKIK